MTGLEGLSIEEDGNPIVVHVHGGHNASEFDGNPEFFFSPGTRDRGPQWVEKKYVYENDQPGDPLYDDFITGEGAVLPVEIFPGGGPTSLAEFFGDHMVVNGLIWPRLEVEPRNYRLRLLNGCESRFLAVQFFEVPAGATDFASVISGPLHVGPGARSTRINASSPTTGSGISATCRTIRPKTIAARSS